MRARLIKDDRGLWLLFNDGQMKQADKEDLRNFLCFFKLVRCLHSRVDTTCEIKRWDVECLEMSDYPGETIAHITDGFQLVLFDFDPFKILFEETKPIWNNLLSVPEYAQRYNKSVEQVKVFCRNGRIPGAKKIGRDWVIPYDAPYPVDKRFRSKKL